MTADELPEDVRDAARTVAPLLRPYVPDARLWDTCLDVVTALRNAHWRHVPPPVAVREQLGRGDPPNDEFRAARAALERTDDHA